MSGPDSYFKKRISYLWKGHPFAFDIGHTIFSSFEVDTGSDLLLRTLALSGGPPPQRILDLGCGCGILGIVLAWQFPDAQVTLVDRDLLAVRYARHNCAVNAIENARVIGSVGFEEVLPASYDLIVSNIPAKIGDRAIEEAFILAPAQRLRAGGAYWFVVVSGLNHLIPGVGTRHQLHLKAVKKRSGHTVYRLLDTL
ncbi:MAG: methyltransferase [Chloroflexaceae bacterium]|nr:methyltransferase [Chloroflexaceae bacterium]